MFIKVSVRLMNGHLKCCYCTEIRIGNRNRFNMKKYKLCFSHFCLSADEIKMQQVNL